MPAVLFHFIVMGCRTADAGLKALSIYPHLPKVQLAFSVSSESSLTLEGAPEATVHV